MNPTATENLYDVTIWPRGAPYPVKYTVSGQPRRRKR